MSRTKKIHTHAEESNSSICISDGSCILGQTCIFGFYRSEMGQFEWLCFALWERKETWSSQTPKPAQTLKTLLLLQITHYHLYIIKRRSSKIHCWLSSYKTTFIYYYLRIQKYPEIAHFVRIYNLWWENYKVPRESTTLG